MNEKLLTITEVAEYLGVTPRWVMDKASSEEIPSFMLGRYRRFRQSDLDAWLDKRKVGVE